MLPGLGFWEFFVIAIVALIVVGPRDLPRMAKTVGGYVRQARGFAKEFRKSFEEMGREIELDELRKEVEALKRGEPFDDIKNELTELDRDVRAVDREVRQPLPDAEKPKAIGPGPATSDSPPAKEAPADAPAPAQTSDAPATEPQPEPAPERDVALKSQSGG